MRYTIGVQLYNKDGTPFDGYYTFGSYGLPFVMNGNITEKEQCRILVFEDIEEAKKYVSILSRDYRKEFKTKAKNTKTDISGYRFYLKKVDSLNFSKKYSLGNATIPKGELKNFLSVKLYDIISC